MLKRFLGSEPKESRKAAPTLDEASEKVGLQIANLDRKIDNCLEEVKKNMARSSDPRAKQKAMSILKQKKVYETQREQLVATQFNIDNLQDQTEQAAITAMTVAAMEAGTKKLQQAQKNMNVTKVEELTDEMANLNDEMAEVNKLLAGSSLGTGVSAAEQDELEDEFNMMQEEMTAMTLAGLSSPSPTPTPEVVIEPLRVPGGQASSSQAFAGMLPS